MREFNKIELTKKLYANIKDLKEFLITKKWSKTDMVGEWFIDEHGNHCCGKQTGDNSLRNRNCNGIAFNVDYGWIIIAQWDENGE